MRFILVFIAVLTFVPQVIFASPKDIILATTTSTQDSGLLDVLIPIFEKQSIYRVKTIAVGTGEALALGRRGEVDVLLVHSPKDEMEFVESGLGINRRPVMHNDFVIVGPKDDPAKIKGKALLSALKFIISYKSTFISRGDNSGTDKKEKNLWEKVGAKPEKGVYIETGQGMGETLRIADQKMGYTLTDRGTYLALKETLDLVIMAEGNKELFNPYSVIEVNPAKFPKVHSSGARAFSDFIVSPEVQEIIRNFGKEKFGQSLFFPDAK